MGNAFFFVLIEQHSPSNFCHSKFHTQCRLGFLEMKQRVGLTQHTYPVLGTYVFQGETRYNQITSMLFYFLDDVRVDRFSLEVMNLRFPCLYFIVFPEHICSAGNHICPTEECRPQAKFAFNYICRDRSRRGVSLQLASSAVMLSEESYLYNCFCQTGH